MVSSITSVNIQGQRTKKEKTICWDSFPIQLSVDTGATMQDAESDLGKRVNGDVYKGCR